MGFNFPNSPTQGTLFTPPGGFQYIYDSGVWRMVATPTQLVTAEARNRLVNPCFQISQENGDTALPIAANAYAADQWVGMSNIATAGAVRTRPAPSGNDYIRTYVTTAKPALGTADYWLFRQNIEGIRVKDFRYGTASAKQTVLQFWAFGTAAGTYTAAVKNSAVDRTFLAPFNLPASVWTAFTIVIPGDTTGTWLTTTGIGMALEFNFATGSTLLGAAGWQAGNKHGITGMTNGAAAANTDFYIADVGLHLDPLNTGVAPPFQMPDEADELLACQRYFYTGIPPLKGNSTTTTAVARMSCATPVVMRINPALALVTALPIFDGGAGSLTGISVAYTSTTVIEIDGTSTGTTAGRSVGVYQSGTGKLNVSARM